ncbi:MAG: rhodanese-like domain-containing protein [Clostridia bacterium]|nr:rhodanese-like domain-containing protein [Clostridia bacterium]
MKKMIKRIVTLSLALLLCFSFAGCGAKYESITAAEAKALMDSETNYVILDVRHDYEFSAEHIADAINIDNDVIADKAESILKDKDQLILVYCKSGNRSKKASEKLAKLGYTNVKEFGGIQQWPYNNKVSG